MNDTWRVIAVLLLAGCVGACGLSGTIVTVTIINEINRHLPPEAQMTIYSQGLGLDRWEKMSRIKAEYRRLCPNGNLLQRRAQIIWVMALCALSAGAILFRLI